MSLLSGAITILVNLAPSIVTSNVVDLELDEICTASSKVNLTIIFKRIKAMKGIHSVSTTLERKILILLSPFSWIPSGFTTLKFYWIGGVVYTTIPLPSTSNIGHSVNHTSSTNALIETKAKMLVVWDDTDE